MTLNHVNKSLLLDSLAWAYAVGCLAMPIFGLVLAYTWPIPMLCFPASMGAPWSTWHCMDWLRDRFSSVLAVNAFALMAFVLQMKIGGQYSRFHDAGCAIHKLHGFRSGHVFRVYYPTHQTVILPVLLSISLLLSAYCALQGKMVQKAFRFRPGAVPDHIKCCSR